MSTIITIMRAARDTLTTLIDLAESLRNGPPSPPAPSVKTTDGPAAEGGLYSSVHGPVGPVRGFGSIYDQPDANIKRG